MHKGVQRLIDLMTKVVMDRSILPLDLGDNLTNGGFEMGSPSWAQQAISSCRWSISRARYCFKRSTAVICSVICLR
jgi:hypothetical protein